jgi:hypothetical protein
MKKWLDNFKHNPIPPLLETGNSAIVLVAERDLLDKIIPVENLWQLPEVQRILKRQKPNGSWTYPGGKESVRTEENYNQLETYRNLGFLVEEYGLNKNILQFKKRQSIFFRFKPEKAISEVFMAINTAPTILPE